MAQVAILIIKDLVQLDFSLIYKHLSCAHFLHSLAIGIKEMRAIKVDTDFTHFGVISLHLY